MPSLRALPDPSSPSPQCGGRASVRRLPLAEFQAELLKQGVPHEHFAFRCPLCRTVQSAFSLIQAGAGTDFNGVAQYMGFSCVGRFAGSPGPRVKPDGQPCNWTLGGLFSLHELEVVDSNGVTHPHFEIASPEEAQALYASQISSIPTPS